MPEPIDFVLSSILLGVGLAMDAFSVSLANGLRDPHMGKLRMGTIAGVFGGFQALMPLVGWFCVHTVPSSSGPPFSFSLSSAEKCSSRGCAPGMMKSRPPP
mgnify:CR=1 FL=1